jgi:hypothetical protein
MSDPHEITVAEYEAALARYRPPSQRAVSAHYDARRRRIVVNMSSGLEVTFSPDDAQGLTDAQDDLLTQIELVAGGEGLHFPALDADFLVSGLLEGRLGSEKWMAARRLAKTG